MGVCVAGSAFPHLIEVPIILSLLISGKILQMILSLFGRWQAQAFVGGIARKHTTYRLEFVNEGITSMRAL